MVSRPELLPCHRGGPSLGLGLGRSRPKMMHLGSPNDRDASSSVESGSVVVAEVRPSHVLFFAEVRVCDHRREHMRMGLVPGRTRVVRIPYVDDGLLGEQADLPNGRRAVRTTCALARLIRPVTNATRTSS